MPRFKIPGTTIERLSLYLRNIREMRDERVLSSQQLSTRVGTSDALIRKDLAYFGEFGIPGQGYRVGLLKEEISRILGLDKCWLIALVGMGNLGAALLAYPGFKQHGFKIEMAFDNDPAKIGRVWRGIRIENIENICQILVEEKIKMGIIATPVESAQYVADRLVQGGVRAILNFAPTRIVVPQRVRIRHVDVSAGLETLSYFMANKGASKVFGESGKTVLREVK